MLSLFLARCFLGFIMYWESRPFNLRTFVLTVCVVGFFVTRSLLFTEAALISASKLDQCVNSGQKSEATNTTTTTTESSSPHPAGENCKAKFTVSVTLDNNQNNTEEVVYWSEAETVAGGDHVVLDEPVRISLSKTEPLIRYPIYYARDVNAQPYEQVVYTTVLGCDDSSTSQSPTCGRAYGHNKEVIPFSEGFCCNCQSCQLVGLCPDNSRANTDCSLFGDAAAASCLKFGDLWYSLYDVGPAETWYVITVTVSQTNATHSGLNSDVKLFLGPDNLGEATADGAVMARLVGDFAGFRQPKLLETHYFAFPSSPPAHPRVKDFSSDEHMLFERHLVSDSGRECDKIGVSYEAFHRQPQRCTNPVGTCLRGQLEELRRGDLKRREEGVSTRYFASSFGELAIYKQAGSGAARRRREEGLEGSRTYPVMTQLRDQPRVDGNESEVPQQHRRKFHKAASAPSESSTAAGNAGLYLAYRVTSGVQASLVTLTFEADRIAFVVNVATGEILAVNITTFEAMSREGRLLVTVQNTGRIQADFYVSVHQCSAGAVRVPQQTRSLLPDAVHRFEFRMEVVETVAANYTCNVTLKSSQFIVLDSTLVTFSTTDQETDKGDQNGTDSGGPNGVPVKVKQQQHTNKNRGCRDCPFYNPLCFLLRSCFWQPFVQLAVVVAVILAIAFVIKHRFFFCACCLKSDEDKREENEKRRAKQQRRAEQRAEEDRRRQQGAMHAAQYNIAAGGGTAITDPRFQVGGLRLPRSPLVHGGATPVVPPTSHAYGTAAVTPTHGYQQQQGHSQPAYYSVNEPFQHAPAPAVSLQCVSPTASLYSQGPQAV